MKMEKSFRRGSVQGASGVQTSRYEPLLAASSDLGAHSGAETHEYDVSILVVGYNSARYLPACLGSIAGAVTSHSYEILFVNNGSDGSEALVRNQHPEAKVLESIGNVGFAAANDYLADNSSGRWLLLLNPDTRLFPGAIDILLDTADRHPEFAALGGTTVAEDGEVSRRSLMELPSLASSLRMLVGKGPAAVAFEPEKPLLQVDALTGGFMMVRRDWWIRLNGMDPSFFLYAEELDFFKRLKDEGGRVAQVADSKIYHDFGSGDVFSANRIRYWATGNAHYMRKHFSLPYAYACIAVIWATMLRRHVLGALLAWRKDDYVRMSKGFAPVVRAPWTWARGYNSVGSDPRRSF